MSDSNTKTFTLEFPVESGGATYKTFSARRPRVRDLRRFLKGVDGDSIEALMNVLSDLCEVPPKVIAEVDVVDFKAMREWFEDFFNETSNA